MDPKLHSKGIAIDGYTEDQIAYHCGLMVEAELMTSVSTTHLKSERVEFLIGRLTWKGHDFLDAARNSTTWSKLTAKLKEKAIAVTFDSLMVLLRKAGEEIVQQGASYLGSI